MYTDPRYEGFKEVIKVVALPDKPSVVALIDVDKVCWSQGSCLRCYSNTCSCSCYCRGTSWTSCRRNTSRVFLSGTAPALRFVPNYCT